MWCKRSNLGQLCARKAPYPLIIWSLWLPALDFYVARLPKQTLTSYPGSCIILFPAPRISPFCWNTRYYKVYLVPPHSLTHFVRPLRAVVYRWASMKCCQFAYHPLFNDSLCILWLTLQMHLLLLSWNCILGRCRGWGLREGRWLRSRLHNMKDKRNWCLINTFS